MIAAVKEMAPVVGTRRACAGAVSATERLLPQPFAAGTARRETAPTVGASVASGKKNAPRF